jgi:hypothetical protein
MCGSAPNLGQPGMGGQPPGVTSMGYRPVNAATPAPAGTASTFTPPGSTPTPTQAAAGPLIAPGQPPMTGMPGQGAPANPYANPMATAGTPGQGAPANPYANPIPNSMPMRSLTSSGGGQITPAFSGRMPMGLGAQGPGQAGGPGAGPGQMNPFGMFMPGFMGGSPWGGLGGGGSFQSNAFGGLRLPQGAQPPAAQNDYATNLLSSLTTPANRYRDPRNL